MPVHVHSEYVRQILLLYCFGFWPRYVEWRS